MGKQFGKTLFGYKPGDVISEIDRMDNEYQQKVLELIKDTEKAKVELTAALEKQAQLEKQLNEYAEREKMITDVMMKAQINAQSIEENARNKARIMMENAEEELKAKQRELEILRSKVFRFKEEFRDVLDKYRVSLENVKEAPEDANFTPTLIVKDKLPESIIS